MGWTGSHSLFERFKPFVSILTQIHSAASGVSLGTKQCAGRSQLVQNRRQRQSAAQDCSAVANLSKQVGCIHDCGTTSPCQR